MAFFVLSRKQIDISCQRSLSTTHKSVSGPSIYRYALACAIRSLRLVRYKTKKNSYPYVLILRLNCYRIRIFDTLPPISLPDCIRLFAMTRHSVLRLMQPGSDVGGHVLAYSLFILLFVKPYTLCEANRFYKRFHTPCPNIGKVTLYILLY